MSRLNITLEYRDGRPSKQSRDLLPEDVAIHIRELAYRVAAGELAGVYVTRARPLDIPTRTGQDAGPTTRERRHG